MYCCLSSDNECNSWKPRGELSPGTASSKHPTFWERAQCNQKWAPREGWIRLLERQIWTIFTEYYDKYYHQIPPVSQTQSDPLTWFPDGMDSNWELWIQTYRPCNYFVFWTRAGSPFAIFLWVKSKWMAEIPLPGSPSEWDWADLSTLSRAVPGKASDTKSLQPSDTLKTWKQPWQPHPSMGRSKYHHIKCRACVIE